MNLNQLWHGNDYAWYQWRGRNDAFNMDAKRVKVIRTYKKRVYGNTRESGFAEVMLLEDDGTPKEDMQGNHRVKEVRARDVFMRWDEYENERSYRLAESERIERENREALAKEQEERTRLVELMTQKWGIPSESVYNVTPTGIHLYRAAIEKELGLRNGT